MTADINVTFIIPKYCRNENDCSEEMQLAYLACEQHCGGGLKAKWVHETQYKQYEGLTKKDVFVLAEFKGELYESLQKTKCLLVGPRCLSCCLTEGTPIPSGPEPVFTIAMRGLVVTASGLSQQEKENIKKKVHWMGGIYSTALTDDTTHLVSNTVLSDKYVKSLEKGIPLMALSWIEAVWDASLQLNINGSSPDFLVHRLPPFANLQVTTTGLNKRDKQMIIKLVEEHGGKFSGAFQSETTDVVVLTKAGVGSEKYKAALEYGAAAVLPAWVQQSAAAGAALPLARFRVGPACTSTPLAESRLPDMSLNFSRITNLRPPSNFVDEARSTDVSMLSAKIKLLMDTKPSTLAKASASASREKSEPASPMSRRNLALLRRAPLAVPRCPGAAPDQEELVNQYLSQIVPEPEKELGPEPAQARDVTTQQESPDITENIADEPTEEIEQIFKVGHAAGHKYQGMRLSEQDYLVGDTRAPAPPVLPAPPCDKDATPPADDAPPRDEDVPQRRKTTLAGVEGGLSPASRFIAMARQGLLGGDSLASPAGGEGGEGGEGGVRTPDVEEALASPNLAALSPTTQRRLRAVRRGEMPSGPIRTPTDPFEKQVATPDSAFGCALWPGPGRLSPAARKRLWSLVHQLPSRSHEPARDTQTPLSEICNRFLSQFHYDPPTPTAAHTIAPRKLQLQERAETPPPKIAKVSEQQSPSSSFSVVESGPAPAPVAGPGLVPDFGPDVGALGPVDAQLQRLTAVQRALHARDLLATSSPPVPHSEPAPESQTNTVGWDDTRPAQQVVEVETEQTPDLK